jgi:hypothetical protein
VAAEATQDEIAASAGAVPGGIAGGSTRAQASRQALGRLGGVDMARALALIGMLAVHVGPEDGPGIGGKLYSLAYGRASILFVLVAGVGISLLSSHMTSSTAARLRLASFSLVLLPLGLGLQLVGYPIAVILHHYAAFFLLGIAVLGLSGRALVSLAVAMTLLGPVLYFLAGTYEPDIFAGAPVTLLDNPLAIVLALLISGPYPLIVWGAPLLWGMWLGRQDLRDARTPIRLCQLGAVVAIPAVALSMALLAAFGEPGAPTDPLMLAVHTPHSQMPLWLISSIGAATFVLGASLLFAARFPRVAAPFALLGQMALSMYVAHVLVLGGMRGGLSQDAVGSSLATVVIMTAAGMLFVLAWRRFYARGPLEMLMHVLPNLMERTLGSEAQPQAAAREREMASAAEWQPGDETSPGRATLPDQRTRSSSWPAPTQ